MHFIVVDAKRIVRMPLFSLADIFIVVVVVINIEDIARWREDMNFVFEWQNNILRTSAASVWSVVFAKRKWNSYLRVMFFLLYRHKEIDKIIEGNYRNYVIDKLTSEIMENKSLGSRM